MVRTEEGRRGKGREGKERVGEQRGGYMFSELRVVGSRMGAGVSEDELEEMRAKGRSRGSLYAISVWGNL